MITLFFANEHMYQLYLSWWNDAIVGHTLNNNPREVLEHASTSWAVEVRS